MGNADLQVYLDLAAISQHHESGKIKKNVFRETRPYLNLLVKSRCFYWFSEKNIILCILKGEMPFKMHKIKLFQRK